MCRVPRAKQTNTHTGNRLADTENELRGAGRGREGRGVKKPAPPAADTAPGMPRAALGTVGNTVTPTCRVRRGRGLISDHAMRDANV